MRVRFIIAWAKLTERRVGASEGPGARRSVRVARDSDTRLDFVTALVALGCLAELAYRIVWPL